MQNELIWLLFLQIPLKRRYLDGITLSALYLLLSLSQVLVGTAVNVVWQVLFTIQLNGWTVNFEISGICLEKILNVVNILNNTVFLCEVLLSLIVVPLNWMVLLRMNVLVIKFSQSNPKTRTIQQLTIFAIQKWQYIIIL